MYHPVFRKLAASAGTEYMLGALPAKVSFNASGPLGAVSMDVLQSKEPTMFRRALSAVQAVQIYKVRRSGAWLRKRFSSAGPG